MNDPTPRPESTHSPEQASEAPAGVLTDRGAREALVEQLAEAIQDAGEYIPGSHGEDYTNPDKAAAAVMPLVDAYVAAQVEAAVSVARAEADAEFDRLEGRILGDEQCCLDACNGGACESCPGCCAGWCINGHDFRGTGEWDRMDDEDRDRWFDVAREHNAGLNAALARAESAETKARALREGLEALADKGYAGTAASINSAWRADVAALLASSPAEGEDEPDGCRLNGCHPAPVSSGEACPDCGNPLSADMRHRVAVAEADGESGYAVCLWPCGHEAGMEEACPLCPAPVVTPSTEGGE